MSRAADRAFVTLLGASLASSAILVALLASLLPHVPRLVAENPDVLGDAVPALILLLASIGITLGLASLARQLWDTLQLIRRLLRARVPTPDAVSRLAGELGIAGRVDVVADERPFAFTYWFARPRVCVSTGLVARLDHEEFHAVLAHERYHLRRRDPLRIVIARYLAAGLYVVPVVDDLVEQYAMLKEVAADEHAVAAMGDVRPLARALYRLMPDAEDVDLGLLAPVGGLSVTEARIEQLVEGGPITLAVPPEHLALSATTLLGAIALLVAQLPLAAGHLDVSLPWPPAAFISAAAIPGVLHQLRLVSRRV